jgi:hypothetical protein
LNVHRVSVVKQTEIHTAEPLVPDPSPFETETVIAKSERYTMRASSTGHVAAFFSASATVLSQEAADGKINVQSACALNTVYN